MELNKRPFNFYVFDETDHKLWQAGLSYKAYLKGNGESAYSFKLNPSKADYGSLKFIIENPKPSLQTEVVLTVKVSATLGWQEKEKMPALPGGLLV